MTIAESATSWAIGIANDQSHGYSQASRWGKPDYDCSSFAISAYRTGAGVQIDINVVNYTGNLEKLTGYGFKEVTKSVNFSTCAGMQPGDIVYYHKSGTNGHAAIYIGNGQIVHARGASYGSTKPGDQGTEIAVTAYYKGNFNRVFRYVGGQSATAPTATPAPARKRYAVNTTMPIVKHGYVGRAVKVWQTIIGVEADGEFGKNTLAATLVFQRSHSLEDDGEVGPLTWAEGLKSIE